MTLVTIILVLWPHIYELWQLLTAFRKVFNSKFESLELLGLHWILSKCTLSKPIHSFCGLIDIWAVFFVGNVRIWPSCFLAGSCSYSWLVSIIDNAFGLSRTGSHFLSFQPLIVYISVRQQDYDAQACNCIIFWLTDLLLARSMEMDVIGWFRTLGLIQRPPKSGNAKEIDNRHPVAVVGTWSVCISLPHEVYRRYFWPHHAESLKKQLFV